MLELTDIDLKQTRFYQEVFTEGHQEGHQEGRQEEGVALILRQLQRRCGELSSTVRDQVARLSLPQLETLGEALLEFRGPADLELWLATHTRE
jgi:predicted transposase YdaD